jgi:hypothetical protein
MAATLNRGGQWGKLNISGVLYLSHSFWQRLYISQDTAARVYQGLIEPYFSYCAPVWNGIGSKLSDKLQKLQNRAARVITRSSYDASSSSVLEELRWNNLYTNRICIYKICL